MSEFNESNDLPRAISEEDTIIEAEITHSGSDQETTTKIDLKSSTDADADDEHLDVKGPAMKKSNSPSEPISTLCVTMRRQIISRSVSLQVFNKVCSSNIHGTTLMNILLKVVVKIHP